MSFVIWLKKLSKLNLCEYCVYGEYYEVNWALIIKY